MSSKNLTKKVLKLTNFKNFYH